jgi:hypothetical protein
MKLCEGKGLCNPNQGLLLTVGDALNGDRLALGLNSEKGFALKLFMVMRMNSRIYNS